MMKSAILALLVCSAAAFSPAKVAKQSTDLSAGNPQFANELGVISPTGYWDPIGLSKNADQETFDRWRLTELKHGRVAMLAVVGYCVQEFARFPGDIDLHGTAFADVPNGLAALSAVPSLGWLQIFFLVGAVDIRGFLGDFDIGKPELDAETLAKRQLQELQHGRLAMLGIMELLRHDAVNLINPGEDGLEGLITGLPFL